MPHPVTALTRLFGPLARYYCTPSRLIDGSPPPMGDSTPTDNRDQDAVCEAGRYLRALGRLQKQPSGLIHSAILESYYRRQGVTQHRIRMEAVIEELDRQGIRPKSGRRRTPAQRVTLYTELLEEAISAYGKALAPR